MSNVVTAVFGGSKVVRTRALYQWDYGQVLQFDGAGAFPDMTPVPDNTDE